MPSGQAPRVGWYKDRYGYTTLHMQKNDAALARGEVESMDADNASNPSTVQAVQNSASYLRKNIENDPNTARRRTSD